MLRYTDRLVLSIGQQDEIRAELGYARPTTAELGLAVEQWHAPLGDGCELPWGVLHDEDGHCLGCAAHWLAACSAGCFTLGLDNVRADDVRLMVDNLACYGNGTPVPDHFAELSLLRLAHDVATVDNETGEPLVLARQGQLVLGRVSDRHDWLAEMFSMRTGRLVAVGPQVFAL